MLLLCRDPDKRFGGGPEIDNFRPTAILEVGPPLDF